jgi:hypothetical protein
MSSGNPPMLCFAGYENYTAEMRECPCFFIRKTLLYEEDISITYKKRIEYA